MSDLPIFYDYQNAIQSQVQPGVIHANDNRLSYMIQRYLLQRAVSVFEFKGMPEKWPLDYVLYLLYCQGYFAVVNTRAYGVVPLACGLRGYDLFYRPTNAVITNPLLTGIMEPRIGTQCALVRLMPDYGNITDLILYYGGLMAMCMESAGVNLFNSKLAWVFFAGDKALAESFKAMFDKIASGNPAAVGDKKMLDKEGKPLWSTFCQDLHSNFIVPELLAAMHTIEAEFDTAIGIPNANTDKRERLITDEVKSNGARVRSNCKLWLQTLRAGLDEVNKMFGLSISVDWREDLKEASEPQKKEDEEE